MANLQKILARQELRFAIIGGLNTILDIAILLFLANFFGFEKIIANIFSTSITFANSFGLNKKYTFQNSAQGKKSLARQMMLFTVVTLFGLWVIQGVIISALQPLAQNATTDPTVATIIAKVIATAVSMIWNFILYKKIVFKN